MTSLMEAKVAEETITINNEKYQIREMTAGEASEYEGGLFNMVNNKPVYDTKNAKKKLVLLTLCQDGKRVFEDKDMGLLDKLPYGILNQIFDVASKLNRLNAETNTKK
jgi:hypothetical protein